MESARGGHVPALPDDILNGSDVALLRGDVVQLGAKCVGQSESHCGFSSSRRTREQPCGRVWIRREFGENAFRFVQTNEISDGPWPVLLRERHRKRESRSAHWFSPPSA